MKLWTAALHVGALLSLLASHGWGQSKLPKPTPLPLSKEPPRAIRIALGRAESSATPYRRGHECAAQTTSGDIHVAQPAPNVITVTMTGSALSKGHLSHETSAGWTFELNQDFEVFGPDDGKLVMTIEGQVVGLLRSTHCFHPHGVTTADCGNAVASVSCGPASILALDLPPRSVASGLNQVVTARAAPCRQPIVPGCFTLHQSFSIGTSCLKAPFVCKAVAAEFAPERHFDRAFLGVFDALGGTPLKENGFRVTIRVNPE